VRGDTACCVSVVRDVRGVRGGGGKWWRGKGMSVVNEMSTAKWGGLGGG